MTATLPNGWRSVRLADIAEIRFSSVDKKSVAGERSVRLCNYMDVWKNAYIRAGMPFMDSTASDADIERFSLREGDVLLTKDSETREEIAEPSVVCERIDNLVLGYHLALIRPRPETVDGFFLAAQLRIPQFRSQFVRAAAGATRYGLSMEAVTSATAWLPPLPEQRRIAEILTAVDDAIDAARVVIAQTRRLKAALLHDLLTHGLPGRHGRSSPSRWWGIIPGQWTEATLGRLIIEGPQNGLYVHEDHYGEGVPILRINDFADGDRISRPPPERVRIPDLEVRKYRLAEDDIVVNRVNSLDMIGKSAIVGDLSGPVVYESNMMRFRVDARVLRPGFLALILACPGTKRQLRGKAKKAVAQASVDQGDLASVVVPLPSTEEQDRIVETVHAVRRRADEGSVALTQLEQSKSALSQALLTGRVHTGGNANAT
jgi:type I restriction enzyme S subunit